jgi:hypothetical protein
VLLSTALPTVLLMDLEDGTYRVQYPTGPEGAQSALYLVSVRARDVLTGESGAHIQVHSIHYTSILSHLSIVLPLFILSKFYQNRDVFIKYIIIKRTFRSYQGSPFTIFHGNREAWQKK